MKNAKMILALLAVLCFAAGFAGNTAHSETLAAGAAVTFGQYEQDGNPANGPEPIEWIVLEVGDEKALLLSRYGLDVQPYNMEYTYISWEDSTLRAWLNRDFINAAFTAEEQQAIVTSKIDNSTPEEGVKNWSGGNDTEDQLFLLSYGEVFSLYFPDREEDRMCAPTEYAVQRGAWVSDTYRTDDFQPTGYWWLRTLIRQVNGVNVNSGGAYYRTHVCVADIMVRPAVWVDITAAGFFGLSGE